MKIAALHIKIPLRAFGGRYGEPSTEAVFGVVSLIFWSVTLSYVVFVMRADNDGEGGIMALITLIRRQRVPGGRRPCCPPWASSARRCSSATA